MIRPLRRAHFRVWCVLALVLPVAFAAAYRAIPRTVTSPLPVRAMPESRGPVVATIDRPAALYRLRGSAEVGYQLEVVLKRPLRSARVVVRAAANADDGDAVDRDAILGTLDVRGLTRIDIGRERLDRFVLSDAIRGDIVDTLDFGSTSEEGSHP